MVAYLSERGFGTIHENGVKTVRRYLRTYGVYDKIDPIMLVN